MSSRSGSGVTLWCGGTAVLALAMEMVFREAVVSGPPAQGPSKSAPGGSWEVAWATGSHVWVLSAVPESRARSSSRP